MGMQNGSSSENRCFFKNRNMRGVVVGLTFLVFSAVVYFSFSGGVSGFASYLLERLGGFDMDKMFFQFYFYVVSLAAMLVLLYLFIHGVEGLRLYVYSKQGGFWGMLKGMWWFFLSVSLFYLFARHHAVVEAYMYRLFSMAV